MSDWSWAQYHESLPDRLANDLSARPPLAAMSAMPQPLNIPSAPWRIAATFGVA